MTALHNMIRIIAGAERSSENLHQLQISLLMMQRDIEQALAETKNGATSTSDFVGTPTHFNLMHPGFVDETGNQYSIEHTQYNWNGTCLARQTTTALDDVMSADDKERCLLSDDIKDVFFTYYDHSNREHTRWPISTDQSEPLPKAVAINITFLHQGTIKQLYLVNAYFNQTYEK